MCLLFLNRCREWFHCLRSSSFLFFSDTRPEQQLARATEQHNGLKHALAQQCHKVSLHTILVGVMGTIYKCHTELPLSKLGLNRCRVRKLTLDLNTHSLQYATKIINTSRSIPL